MFADRYPRLAIGQDSAVVRRYQVDERLETIDGREVSDLHRNDEGRVNAPLRTTVGRRSDRHAGDVGGFRLIDSDDPKAHQHGGKKGDAFAILHCHPPQGPSPCCETTVSMCSMWCVFNHVCVT